MGDWSPMKYKVVKVVVVRIVAVVVVICKCTSAVAAIHKHTSVVVAARSELEATSSVALVAAVLAGVNIFQGKCNIH